MLHHRIKTFWIDKINDLITNHSVQPDEADWQDQINNIKAWNYFEPTGLRICQNIYTKANQIVPPNVDILGNNYGSLCGDAFSDLSLEYEELVKVYKTKIGVDPEDATTVTIKINNVNTQYPKWKYDIDQRLATPDNPAEQVKLTDIPGTLDLTDLLWRNEIYKEIKKQLPSLILGNLAVADQPKQFGFDWKFKLNTAELTNLKNLKANSVPKVDYDALNDKLTQINNELNVLKSNGDISNNNVKDLKKLKLGHSDIGTKLNIDITQNFLPDNWATKLVNIQELQDRENQIRTACGLDPTDAILNNWENDFNNVRLYFINNLGITNLTSLPTIPTGEDLNSLLTKHDEYNRIHTKLNGKISDNELQALLDAIPTCPHTDYNSIKQERDTLKTENTQLKEHQCDCESKVAAKEKEIITKIITDLSLSTEREREREREPFRSRNHRNQNQTNSPYY